MIEFKKVSKSYEGHAILENISIKVNNASLFGLAGNNGSGKTTLMNMILNRVDFTGTILIDGIPNYTYLETAREKIAFVPDVPFLYDYLTGIEFIRFVLDMHKIPFAKIRLQAEILLKLFDLSDFKELLIRDYSFGMKRKLNLITVFLQKPRYILLDEPVIGLDTKSILILKELLRVHSGSGSTVLFSTNLLNLMENLCDDVAIIYDKKLMLYNKVKNISQNDLEDIYFNLYSDDIMPELNNYILEMQAMIKKYEEKI